MLGSHSNGHRVTGFHLMLALGGNRQRAIGKGRAGNSQLAVRGNGNNGRQEVHLGRSDKSRHKNVGWIIVEVRRRPDLFDQPCPQDNDPVRQRHRLDLVVRDVDHGNAESAVKLGDLDTHLRAQLCIEV